MLNPWQCSSTQSDYLMHVGTKACSGVCVNHRNAETGEVHFKLKKNKNERVTKKERIRKGCLALLEDLQEIFTFPFFEYFGNA